MTENRIEKLEQLASELVELQEKLKAPAFRELHDLLRETERMALSLRKLFSDFMDHPSYLLPSMDESTRDDIYFTTVDLRFACREVKFHLVTQLMAQLIAWLNQVLQGRRSTPTPLAIKPLRELMDSLLMCDSVLDTTDILQDMRRQILDINRVTQSRHRFVQQLYPVVSGDYPSHKALHKLLLAIGYERKSLEALFDPMLNIITWCDYLTAIGPDGECCTSMTLTVSMTPEQVCKYFDARKKLLKLLRGYIEKLESAQAATAQTEALMI